MMTAVAVVTVGALYVGSGWMYWTRAASRDQLGSRRARNRALALAGFTFPVLIAAAALRMATGLLAMLTVLVALPVAALLAWQVVWQVREIREARARNSALGWPRGGPPRHPGWGLLVLGVWTIGVLETIGAADGHGWVTGLAHLVGLSYDTVLLVLLALWLLGVLVCIGWVLRLVVRRSRWRRTPAGGSGPPRRALPSRDVGDRDR